MKKIVPIFIAGASALVAAIYLSGYEYIFKAIRINIKKGPLTPSIDDEEKFPSHPVKNHHPEQWKKSADYNKAILSEKILKDLEKTRTSSLIVAHDNKLVYEHYWKKHDASSLMNSFSMAKGILSILVGCAIDDGYIDSEDQHISSVFAQYENSRYGKFLTFRHLMTMQAGLDWKEEYHHPFAPNSKQYFIDDLTEQALSVDVKEMPGITYEYQSVAAQLLGLALKKVTGKKLSDYLSEKMWQPLGMQFPAKWSTDDKGMEKAFCCIHATARDFARIGQLLLQEGNWKGKQLISKEYCQKLMTPTKENNAFGYTIWTNNDSEVKHSFFYGFLGQFIIMIPEKKMVIIKTGLYNRLEVDKKQRPLQVELLIEELSKLA